MDVFNPKNYLTDKELEIYNQSKAKYKQEKYHSLYLYNTQTLDKTYIRYRYDNDNNLMLNKRDLGTAYEINNGDGFQEYRRAAKELTNNPSDFINLCTYIVRTIEGDNSPRLDVNLLQKDWYNDSI